MSEQMKSALRLAGKGLHVFPCKARGKQPVTSHGFKDACTNADAVQAWWAATPAANIGIATGCKWSDRHRCG